MPWCLWCPWWSNLRGDSASEHRPGGDAGLVGGDLLAIAAAAAQHLDEAAAGEHGEALRSRLDDLADLLALDLAEGAGDALARVEDLELLAAYGRPGTGRRIGGADQIVDDLDAVRPVDPRFGIAEPALIARLRFILDRLLRLAGENEIGGFEEGGDAGWEDLVEIDGA